MYLMIRERGRMKLMKQKVEKVLTRKVFIIIVTILLSIVCVLMMIQNYLKIKEQRMQNAIVTGNFDSIRDILEYYDCVYIKHKKSQEEGYSVDIYTKFKYDLYDDDESNEEFYNKVINKIAEFLNYDSFRMIDESKEEKIEIRVICDGKKIKTIIINDIEDYFMYMDSQIDAKKYKKVKETEFVVESPELQSCIDNNWDKSIEFGTKEAIFQNYDVYFDEGIKVRIISDKVYNVIFSTKYEKNVINGLNSSSKRDIIIRELGEPAFKNSDKSIIGYKNEDVYIFFGNDEISVYRNGEENYDNFFELVDEYLDKQYTFVEFMNELTYIWPDYETYEYSQNTVFMTFPTKGIEIKVNYENSSGIIFYNNIGFSQNKLKKYLESTDFISQMKIDSIYTAEVRRVKKTQESIEKCEEYKEEYEAENNRNHGEIYDYYMDFDSNQYIQAIYFISQSDEYCDNQLIENINNYVWINDTTFIYSKKKRGIYSFDLANGTKSVIVTGKEQFNINSYKNGILSYDETSIDL